MFGGNKFLMMACATIPCHVRASFSADVPSLPADPTSHKLPRQRQCSIPSSFSIEAHNLSFNISRHNKFIPILKNCSLQVPPGQLWMLLGPNGCGKSTLLKILAGVLHPSDGTVNVNRPNSFVFQNPDHQVVMPTVEADVAFGLGKFSLGSDEVRCRVAKALEAVGMFEYLQMGVINAVKKCVRGPEQVAALWVTHRLEELKYADGAVYMEDGRVIMQGIIPFGGQANASALYW
ncbi:hypothetical protein QJS04_geneDACA023957 [Acorus gramineus]|uniref:AAA+ ATPase domain-containing protein n=1 Tax=Acorus gramineus TaxID=55184 RepID=A0AAV9B4K4_ACOGR|nr:hypothetical protein QJS04_geneDACA023957 [Acorus gramineus]